MPKLCFIALLFLMSGCALFQPADRFGARSIAFSELSGWTADAHADALKTFIASCQVLARAPKPVSTGSGLQISAELWQSLCQEAQRIKLVEARAFFERRFVPFRVNNNGKERGLFTGYYEPMLYGATHRYGDFQYPLYALPLDVKPDEPYYTHAEINAGALSGRRLEIVWVDDPVMRFFMQVQGSGRVKLTNRKELYVGYAGKNGHKYASLGKVMGEEDLLPKDQINFFTIRQWLYQHPEQAMTLMERNRSYVFFKIRNEPGAVGAAGAVLTPGRSLAVDSGYIPYGLPIFLETILPPEPQQEPMVFNRLMVAQDTGGAIRGPVRGDIFFGTGDEAEYFAGYMAQKGMYSVLVPKEIVNQLPRDDE